MIKTDPTSEEYQLISNAGPKLKFKAYFLNQLDNFKTDICVDDIGLF